MVFPFKSFNEILGRDSCADELKETSKNKRAIDKRIEYFF
jgi:hypothetical protein